MYKKKKPILYTSDIDTYTIPLTTVEEAAAYLIVSFEPAFIGCFMYPWKLSHMQLFNVQKVLKHFLSSDILVLLGKVVLTSPGTSLKRKMLFISIKGKYSSELRYL